jgi:hypothetical protein
VRRAGTIVMKMTGIWWMYSYSTETRHLIRSNPVVYVRENLVHISFGEPHRLSEVSVRSHFCIQRNPCRIKLNSAEQTKT